MARLFEYSGNVNPALSFIPVRVFGPELHSEGATRIEQFDLSNELDCEFQCTTPNLLAGVIRILSGESVAMPVKSTSTSFYVLRGSGKTEWG